jgi:hypothetical protein
MNNINVKSSDKLDLPAILKRISSVAADKGYTKDYDIQGRLSFKRAYATRNAGKYNPTLRAKLLKELQTTRVVNPGLMFFFHYDPKGADVLTQWDEFPLIFVLEIYKDGFLGLNLHFLPALVRQRIFVAFLKNAVMKKGELDRLKLNYQISRTLVHATILAPAIKRYLWGQLRSPMKVVPADLWEDVLFLPMQQMHFNQKKSR